jgi:hypothetical protein
MHRWLIPRFPGSKRAHLQHIRDDGYYQAVVEPFLGSGRLSLKFQRPGAHLYVAEKDPLVWSIWRLWLDGRIEDSRPHLQQWQARLKDVVEAHRQGYEIDLQPEGQTKKERLAYRQRQRKEHLKVMSWCKAMDGLWRELLEVCEASPPLDEMAGASQFLRVLTYGGVIRSNASGEWLNIKWCVDQIAPALRLMPRYPTPQGHWHLYQDCREAIAAARSNCRQATLALLDPPYYVPPGGRADLMRPCYPGHRPHDIATLNELCLEPARQLLWCDRLVVTNYWSHPAHSGLSEIALTAGLPIATREHGLLNGMNHAAVSVTKRRDFQWTIGQDYRRTQLSLFVA